MSVPPDPPDEAENAPPDATSAATLRDVVEGEEDEDLDEDELRDRRP